MKKLTNLIGISLCAFAISGCATIPREIVSLPETVQSNIETTDVYMEECSQTMKAEIQNPHLTTYTSGALPPLYNLIPVLIDGAIMAHRDACADDAMVGIQKELQSFNFQEKVNQRLAQTLQDTPWLHVRQIQQAKTVTDETVAGILHTASCDSLLVTRFVYKLNPQFSVLNGTLYLTLYPASSKMKRMVNAEYPLEKPIFKCQVSATASLPQAGDDIEINGKRWAQDNGAFLKSSLENVIQQMFVNLEAVLKNPGHLPGE